MGLNDINRPLATQRHVRENCIDRADKAIQERVDPVVDIIQRTSREMTAERPSAREFGRGGDDGWLAANALSSVKVTALKMSNNVAVFEGVLRLIVLKYPSIVFVLSSERTSRRN